MPFGHEKVFSGDGDNYINDSAASSTVPFLRSFDHLSPQALHNLLHKRDGSYIEVLALIIKTQSGKQSGFLETISEFFETKSCFFLSRDIAECGLEI